MPADKEVAMKYADQVCAAVAKKLPDYKVYPRFIEAPEYNFVEFALRPVKGSVNDEVAVAYSDQYLADMADPDTKLLHARRIYRDMQISLGIDPDANSTGATAST